MSDYLPMKKVLMLLVAVASATTAFAKTGETHSVTSRQVTLAGTKTVKALRFSPKASCSVTVSSGGTTVTATGSCGKCSTAQACQLAYQIAMSYLWVSN